MGGILQGLHEGMAERLERKHAQEDQIKKEKREFYLKGATNPDATEAQQKLAWDEYGKLSGPEVKKGIKQLAPMFNKLKQAFHKGGQQPQQQGQPQQQSGPAPAPSSGGQPMSEQMPNGQPAMDAAKQKFQAGPPPTIYPNADSIQQRKSAYEDEEFQKWLKRGREVLGPDASKRDLAEYAGSKGTKLPTETRPPIDALTATDIENKDGTKSQIYVSKDGHQYHLDRTPLDPSEVASIAKILPKESAKGGYIRSVPHSVGLKDARKQAENGAEFPGADGKMIDLDSLPEDMGLQAMVRGNEIFWVPVTPSQKTISVGGKVYGVNPYQVEDVGKPGAAGPVELGPSKTGSNHTSEQIAINPITGEVTKNTLRSSTTPQTPGAHQPGTAPAPAPQGTVPQGSGATAAQPKPAPAPSGSSDIKGMPSGMYYQMLQRVTPVREAATQVFGDPSQPDLKGLKDYMQLADDPQARQRVGTALRLTFDGLNQATSGGAHISAEAGPVSVSTGGIGQLFTNWLGVPQATAAQQTKIIQDAINKMTPEEKEYYDSVMSAFSTVVGLRSLTRASAAQSSVSAIERELPIIGVNTTDSKQFADQMQRLAEVVYNGTKGIPPGMIDPKLVDRIKNLPSEMQKMKSKGPAKAPESKDKKGRPPLSSFEK